MKLKSPISVEETNEFGWWIEIITHHPVCTYYFGDYDTKEKAEWASGFYVEDLKKDGAEEISTEIKYVKAGELTDLEDEWRAGSVVILPPTLKWRSRTHRMGTRSLDP